MFIASQAWCTFCMHRQNQLFSTISRIYLDCLLGIRKLGSIISSDFYDYFTVETVTAIFCNCRSSQLRSRKFLNGYRD